MLVSTRFAGGGVGLVSVVLVVGLGARFADFFETLSARIFGFAKVIATSFLTYPSGLVSAYEFGETFPRE